MLKKMLQSSYWSDPHKKPIYKYAALWISMYVIRGICYLIFGVDFHYTSINLLILWTSGVFFGFLAKELFIYKRREFAEILKDASMTNTDLMKIIDGASTRSDFIADILIDAEDSKSLRQHVYRDKLTGKLFAFEYVVGYDNEILEDYLDSENVFEVKAVKKTVTVYERV